MNKYHLLAALGGLAAGYFLSAQLAAYQPWTFAATKGLAAGS